MSRTLLLIKRMFSKPPVYILYRVFKEGQQRLRYLSLHQRVRQFRPKSLLKQTAQISIDGLWQAVLSRPVPFICDLEQLKVMLLDHPSYREIQAKAQKTLNYQVQLFGYEPFKIGPAINWFQDHQNGVTWPIVYYKKINYVDFSKSQDVKIPWELSRLQWLIPIGLVYAVEREQQYAVFVKNILEDWIQNNPFEYGIHWTCTMEVALRLISVIWLLSLFGQSSVWQEQFFQEKILAFLYQHASFIEANLEKSDINGNHFTANAAGLVFAGLFLVGKQADHWLQLGRKILEGEIVQQVFAEGVDFEGSIPYHRLVLELFFWPALYLERRGYSVSNVYRERLLKMAQFIVDYTYPDGTSPIWGDNDEARVLPFGVQASNDHRYLSSLVALLLDPETVLEKIDIEVLCIFGAQNIKLHPKPVRHLKCLNIIEYPQSGFYILKQTESQIFIDAGPVGLAGRGGHGHNDFLSFELFLSGQKIFIETGCGVYTGDPHLRNQCRSVRVHNTPQFNNEEQFPFIRWDYLWNLQNQHYPVGIEKKEHGITFKVAHQITHHRTFCLLTSDCFSLKDEFIGPKTMIIIPFIVDPDLNIKYFENHLLLQSAKQSFFFEIECSAGYELELKPTKVYPQYGKALDTHMIRLRLFLNQKPLVVSVKVSTQ